MKRIGILGTVAFLLGTAVSLGAQGLYSDADSHHLGSEWAVNVDPATFHDLQRVTFEIQYGPPHWVVRFRVGASADAAWVPGALVGIEVPLIEADSENSNVRAWGIYIRGTQRLDARLGAFTEVGLGASTNWFGISGPGIVVGYGSDGLVKIAMTINGAVGLK